MKRSIGGANAVGSLIFKSFFDMVVIRFVAISGKPGILVMPGRTWRGG